MGHKFSFPDFAAGLGGIADSPKEQIIGPVTFIFPLIVDCTIFVPGDIVGNWGVFKYLYTGLQAAPGIPNATRIPSSSKILTTTSATFSIIPP
jgi:hypothetical protein